MLSVPKYVHQVYALHLRHAVIEHHPLAPGEMSTTTCHGPSPACERTVSNCWNLYLAPRALYLWLEW